MGKLAKVIEQSSEEQGCGGPWPCRWFIARPFFSRISNTIVLKSGNLKVEIRIKMGDVPRRAFWPPFRPLKGPGFGHQRSAA
eukprot:1156012-Pelagomonas_calceolata.AAC.3